MGVSHAAAPSSDASLPEAVAEFIQSGVSITVASRDDRLVPSIAKAVGCRVSADRRHVTILMSALAAEVLARDVARQGQVAVVFSRPTTNQTVQLKGRDAVSVPVQPADGALVRRYLALLADDLGPLGWDQSYVDAVFWHDPAQLIAIRFAPEGAFQQTPGPGAGKALDLRSGARS